MGKQARKQGRAQRGLAFEETELGRAIARLDDAVDRVADEPDAVIINYRGSSTVANFADDKQDWDPNILDAFSARLIRLGAEACMAGIGVIDGRDGISVVDAILRTDRVVFDQSLLIAATGKNSLFAARIAVSPSDNSIPVDKRLRNQYVMFDEVEIDQGTVVSDTFGMTALSLKDPSPRVELYRQLQSFDEYINQAYIAEELFDHIQSPLLTLISDAEALAGSADPVQRAVGSIFTDYEQDRAFAREFHLATPGPFDIQDLRDRIAGSFEI